MTLLYYWNNFRWGPPSRSRPGGVSSVPFHLRLHLISLSVYYDDPQKKTNKLRILNNSHFSFFFKNSFISSSSFRFQILHLCFRRLLCSFFFFLLSRFSAADAFSFKQTWPQKNSPSSVVLFSSYRNDPTINNPFTLLGSL